MGKKPAKSRVTAKKEEKAPSTTRSDPRERRDKGRRSKAAAKQTYRNDLEDRLAAAGLAIKHVSADGNCWFRSLADQLQGSESGHLKLRRATVDFMLEHQDDFQPYMEDDENFGAYCKRMSKDGTWAGQQEQVAAARHFNVRIAIYQAGQPCWVIQTPDSAQDAQMLHMSYHDGEHYNSVRLKGDLQDQIPQPVPAACCNAFSGTPLQEGDEQAADDDKIRQVLLAVGSHNRHMAVQALAKHQGQVDEAVEDLIAAAGAEDAELSEKEPQEQHAVVATADHSSANHRQPSSIREPQQTSAETAPHPTEACPDASVSEAAGAVGQDDDLQADDESFVVDEIRPEPPAKQVKSGKPVAKHKGAEKGTGRNQRCSCGSHKKFKNCCGAARSRASAGAAIAEQQQQSTPSANPLYV